MNCELGILFSIFQLKRKRRKKRGKKEGKEKESTGVAILKKLVLERI